MPLSNPRFEINGKRAVELWSEYDTVRLACIAYNTEFGTHHPAGSFQYAIKKWMIRNPKEAREIYNKDCLKHGWSMPTDQEWDRVVRKKAKGFFGSNKVSLSEWEAWYTSNYMATLP